MKTITQPRTGLSFSSILIPEVLAGRKTETRRLLNQQPTPDATSVFYLDSPEISGQKLLTGVYYECPDGLHFLTKTRWDAGDKLYVKEAYDYITLAKNEVNENTPRRPDGVPVLPYYRADWIAEGNNPWDWPGKWQSGRFMPRWILRTQILVIDLWAHFLQDITEESVLAELGSLHKFGANPFEEFIPIWDKINPQRPWESNPAVLATEFTLVS